jgi:hypothetical protein
MKTYIVYVNGIEAGYVKASSHNAAEKKAQKQHVSHDEVLNYCRVNPTVSFEEAFKRKALKVSVAYTEI